MSKFREMFDAAQAAQKDWFDSSERCKNGMAKLLIDFINYCEIPFDCVEYLRYDDNSKRFLAAEGSGHYTVSGATTYDDEISCWRAGMSIVFSQARFVGFGITLKESKDGKFLVTLPGEQSQRQIDINDTAQCNSFYDDIVAKIVKVYQDERKPPGQRVIGFNA